MNWEDVTDNWESTGDNIWNDIYILSEAKSSIKGSISDYIKGNPWDRFKKDIGEEKTDRLIKIVCRINNLEYSEVIKPNTSIKIEVKHIERAFSSIPKVKIRI